MPPPGVAAVPLLTPEERERATVRQRAQETKAKRKDAVRRRWAMLNDFADHGMAGLRPSDAAVWLALFRHARADGVATVSRSRIEAMTGVNRKTITASLRRLADAGWIALLRRGGPNGGIAVYKVCSRGEGVGK